jgi:hypothetical protein
MTKISDIKKNSKSIQLSVSVLESEDGSSSRKKNIIIVHYATSRKATGSIPNEVIGFFS